MKVVILAGGMGTRIAEKTISKSKPMVLIGGKPIIWHPMNNISNHKLLNKLWDSGRAPWKILKNQK